jgi:hypothetical protein
MGLIDVLTVHAERFTDPQPGTRQQPDQGLHCRGAQRRPERPGSCHQREDLLV